MTTPETDPVAAPAGEADLRAELEEVRGQIVDLWHSGDDTTGREIVGAVVGGLTLAVGALLTGVLVTVLDEETAGFVATVAVLVVVLFAVTAIAFRPAVGRRVRLYRDVRRLRRRERELVALLPAGTTGRGSYRRYYAERFSNPVMILVASGLLVIALITLLG